MTEKTISAIDAAKWMLKVASADGVVSPNAMKVIGEFVTEYELDPEWQQEQPAKTPDRPIRTKKELFRELRQEMNKELERQRHNTTGCNYMKDRIDVEMPDGAHLSEATNIDTLRILYPKLEYQKVADAGIKFNDRLPLVTRRTNSRNYSYENNGWYILSNITTKNLAICLNKLFDALDVCMIARVILR